MLDQLEVCLLKQVAHDTFEVPRLLVSPRAGNIRNSLITPLGIQVFGVIARDALQGKPASFISIVSSLPLDAQQQEYLRKIWLEGKAGDPGNTTAVIDQLRDVSMARQADKSITDYQKRTSNSPTGIQHEIESLGSSLETIAHQGESEDPTPNFDDPEFEVTSTFGDKIIDDLFGTRHTPHGGMLNYATVLWVAATKSGKSTFMITLAARSIIMGQEVTYISNELSNGMISNNVLDAVRKIYAGDPNEPTIDQAKEMIKKCMVVYTIGTQDFEAVRSKVYWHRSPLTIIDSLDHLGYPATSDKYYKPEDKHNDRASTLLEMSRRYNVMLHIPANSSENNQKQLRDDITKMDSVMGFGSAHYQNTFDLSFGLSRNKSIPCGEIVKRMVNRITGQQGEVWDFMYDMEGRYYAGQARRRP